MNIQIISINRQGVYILQTKNRSTTMKKLMMIAALALLTAAGANAQEMTDRERKSPAERATMQTERMVKELGLDADQAAKANAVNLKYADQAEQLRKERAAQMEKFKGQGKAMHAAHDGEMKGILSAEQYIKYQAFQEARKEKHKEKRKAARGDQKQ